MNGSCIKTKALSILHWYVAIWAGMSTMPTNFNIIDIMALSTTCVWAVHQTFSHRPRLSYTMRRCGPETNVHKAMCLATVMESTEPSNTTLHQTLACQIVGVYMCELQTHNINITHTSRAHK